MGLDGGTTQGAPPGWLVGWLLKRAGDTPGVASSEGEHPTDAWHSTVSHGRPVRSPQPGPPRRRPAAEVSRRRYFVGIPHESAARQTPRGRRKEVSAAPFRKGIRRPRPGRAPRWPAGAKKRVYLRSEVQQTGLLPSQPTSLSSLLRAGEQPHAGCGRGVPCGHVDLTAEWTGVLVRCEPNLRLIACDCLLRAAM